MKKLLLVFLVVLFAAVAWGGIVAAQDDALPAFADLEAGAWTMIEPGGDTICSNGTPYAFFARPADEPSDKLLIHFQGGGACWFGENCDLQATPTYDPFVDESDDPTNYDGIFNFTNEENPFRDYNMVMVPYCTADVHIGNAVSTYAVQSTGAEVTIYHNGFVNATTVLDWVFNNVQEPETVFVTGCSAGSIPSPFYTQFVAEAYPGARIEQLGDAAGAYRNPDLAGLVFGTWGTESILPEDYAEAGLEIGSMTFESFYMMSGSLYPEITFTQYNAAYDAVQTGFNMLGGLTDFDLLELLTANFADINAEVDNFRSFTVGGDSHCITPTADFYTYGINGARFVDWVAALAAGDDVETMVCEDCSVAETVEAGG